MRVTRLAVLSLPLAGLMIAGLADCVGDSSTTSDAVDSGAGTDAAQATDGTVFASDSGGSVDAGTDTGADSGPLCVVPNKALSGTVDNTFSTGTKVVGAGHFYARAATVDPLGGVYVVGSVIDNDAGGGAWDIAILHILQDGTVDPAFTPNANPRRFHYSLLDFGFAAATLPSGAPIFAGSSSNGTLLGNGTVLSVTDGGAYNAAFNPIGATPGYLPLPSGASTIVGSGCGTAISDTSSTLTTINGIAASADKIVVVGSNVVNVCDGNRYEPVGTKGFVMLLNKDGSTTGTFNGGSVLLDATVGGFFGVAFDANGNIVTVGQNVADAGVNRVASVRRFSPAGAASGTVDITATGGFIGRSIGVLPDGKIVVAGSTQLVDPTFGGALIVVRLTSALAIDNTFNGGKPLVTSLGFDAYTQFGSLAILCDGTVLAAGTWTGDVASADPQDLGLAKILGTGVLDNSFGEGGIARSVINGAEIPVGATQDPTTGKVVVIGRDAVPNLVIARFNP